MLKLIDLKNKKFGRLKVINRKSNSKRGSARWLCICDCGTEKIILGTSLRSGCTKSCGCLRKADNNIHTQTYRSWGDMKNRCSNPNNGRYKDYGGRGITVCKRWMKFENFLEDMGEKPHGLQVDRINNNKNYNKSNCRWVTTKQNNRNKRNNVFITYKGEKKCLVEWAEEFGIQYDTLRYRLKIGWLTEEALRTPVGQRR